MRRNKEQAQQDLGLFSIGQKNFDKITINH